MILLLVACAPDCEGRICVVAGTGELGFNGQGLPALETRLASPTSVTTDPEGRLAVVDYSNMLVRVLDDEGALQTLAGNGVHAYSQPGEPALQSPLENPIDAAWGPDGLLYVLPQHEGRLIRVDEQGLVEVCAGTGELGDEGDGGDALEATMGYGGGFALASDGGLYIADSTSSRVRHVDAEGLIHTVLGTGSAGRGEAGFGPEVAIRYPERVVLDEAGGRLLVADAGNDRVLSLDLQSGQVVPLLDEGLDQPVGLAVTPSGGVVISDQGQNRLVLVDASGSAQLIAGGLERGDEPSEHEAPLDFALHGPAGLAWDGDGALLVAERLGHRVLRWEGALDALD